MSKTTDSGSVITLIVSVIFALAVVFFFASADVSFGPLVALFLAGVGAGFGLRGLLPRVESSRSAEARASRASTGEPAREERPRRRKEKESGGARNTGTVKWFKDSKGFGFITPSDGGRDYFVHRSAIQNGRSLNRGDEVEFEIQKDEKGRLAAENVVRLES